MSEDSILEFLLVCESCKAKYLAEIPVNDIYLDDELAPMECEDCGNIIDANKALKQAISNAQK